LDDVLAYTWRATKHQRRAITVPVRLTIPPTKAERYVIALVDTGATSSCVSDALAKQLCLIPLSMVNVNSVHGRKAVPVLGDMAVTNGQNETVFSFRIPPRKAAPLGRRLSPS
jgi:predicted aspartyl protease